MAVKLYILRLTLMQPPNAVVCVSVALKKQTIVVFFFFFCPLANIIAVSKVVKLTHIPHLAKKKKKKTPKRKSFPIINKYK